MTDDRPHWTWARRRLVACYPDLDGMSDERLQAMMDRECDDYAEQPFCHRRHEKWMRRSTAIRLILRGETPWHELRNVVGGSILALRERQADDLGMSILALREAAP